MKKINNIDTHDTIESSLLFWAKQYFRHKMLTISSRLVTDCTLLHKKANIEILEVNTKAELDNFMRYMIFKLNFSNLKTYYFPMKHLLNYLSSHHLVSLKDINDTTITEYFTLYKSKYTTSTLKQYRVIFLNFFTFIEKYSNHSFDIEVNINYILRGNTNPAPRYLKKEELKHILQQISTQTLPASKKRQFVTLRNTLIIKMLILSGMRTSEVAFLKIKDIIDNGEYYAFNIIGKGNKYRQIMIAKKHIQHDLESYIKIKNSIVLPHIINNECLFISKTGRNITIGTIYEIVKRLLKTHNLLGIKRNGGHVLRHSYASFIYKQTNDIVLLQKLLGHSSIETTKIYTHIDREILTNAANYMNDICCQ